MPSITARPRPIWNGPDFVKPLETLQLLQRCRSVGIEETATSAATPPDFLRTEASYGHDLAERRHARGRSNWPQARTRIRDVARRAWHPRRHPAGCHLREPNAGRHPGVSGAPECG